MESVVSGGGCGRLERETRLETVGYRNSPADWPVRTRVLWNCGTPQPGTKTCLPMVRLALVRFSLGVMLLAASGAAAEKIDRHALVTRHNPHLTAIDPWAPFSVGNGEFCFTADVTGLQTFYDPTRRTASRSKHSRAGRGMKTKIPPATGCAMRTSHSPRMERRSAIRQIKVVRPECGCAKTRTTCRCRNSRSTLWHRARGQ